MVNGLGSARELAAAGLVFVPVAVAAVPAQPAARPASQARAAAAARRVVVLAMVPPVCRRSPWTVRLHKAAGIGAATRAGLWPARIFPAVAMPQSGHGTRGAVRDHPRTPGRAGPLGRSRARGRGTGGAGGVCRGTGRGGGPGRSITYAGSSAAETALTLRAGLGLIAAVWWPAWPAGTPAHCRCAAGHEEAVMQSRPHLEKAIEAHGGLAR